MKKALEFIFNRLRVAKAWNYKFPLILAFTYIWYNEEFNQYLAFFCSIMTSVGFASFAYLLNDWSDIKADTLSGKDNALASVEENHKYFLLLLFLLIALIPWMYLPFDSFSLMLILTEIFLFIFYSFPPFRLKERGIFGVLADSAYAHVIPAVLASHTFLLFAKQSIFDHPHLIFILMIWQFISGIRNIISHQIIDFDNDIKSGIKTFTTNIGVEKSTRILKSVLIPIELIIFAFFIFLLQAQVEFLIYFIPMFLILAFVFLNKEKQQAESELKNFSNTVLDYNYIHWLPLAILISLSLNNYFTLGILLAHLIIFRESRMKIRNLFV